MSNREMPPLPEHKGEAPVVEQPQVKKPVVPGPGKFVGIEVVALEKGIFRNQRKIKGDKFFVPKFEQLGSWMKALDPEVQKKHEQNLRLRKTSIREKQEKAGK